LYSKERKEALTRTHIIYQTTTKIRMPSSHQHQRIIRRRPSGAAVVLGLTSVATIGAIVYSHYAQVRDKQVMREGVERDKQRLAWKRKQQQQQDQGAASKQQQQPE
jgi:hypothetical protein